MKNARLGLLLVFSYGLRLWLAFSGGQGFWPDESRYDSSRAAVQFLRHGQWHEAGSELLGHADHLLFRWFGLVPAWAESLLGRDLPAWAAAYFGLFSVGSIYWVWAIARRAGARDGEALWAAYLAACSTCLFYYSRHLLPYDIALFLMLAGFWRALGPWSWRNAFGVGVLTALGFLTYDGYWLLGGTVLILFALLGEGGAARLVPRSLGAGAGLGFVLAGVGALAAWLGHDLVASYRDFAGTITQGDFHLGYRLIPEYLWSAEGALLLVWLAAFAWALGESGRERRLGRLAWYAGGTLLLAGGLIFFSDLVPKFVVYGRLARGLVPFLCLGAAAGVTRFLDRQGRHRAAWDLGLAVLVGACAAWNFSVPLRQVYPDGFRRLAAQAVAREPVDRAWSLLFSRSLQNLDLDAPPPAAAPILRRAQPFQFRPYQYEGETAAWRADVNRHDVSMRLVPVPGRLDASALGRWQGYPGPVRFSLRFPAHQGVISEPLLAAGTRARGEVVYVRYLDSNHVAFGLDQGGADLADSGPIEIDYARPHELLVFAGFLAPPVDAARATGLVPEAALHDHLLVMLDGHWVFLLDWAFFPALPGTISFGVNFVGGTVLPSFSGEILDFGSAPAATLKSALAVLAAGEPAEGLGRPRPDDWQGAPGPVRLRLRLPAAVDPSPQPLLSVGKDGAGGLFFLVRIDREHLRLGFRRPGREPLLSAALPVDPAAMQILDLSAGSMLPPDDGVVYAADASLGALRNLLYVRWNGLTALRVREDFVAAPGPLAIGTNLTAAAASRPYFLGKIVSLAALPPSAIPGLIPLAEVVPGGPDAWRGYWGPIQLKIIFPAKGAAAEPLLVSGATGRADFLYVRYDDDSHIRLGFDHWGAGGPISAPVAIQPGAEQELVVSLGSLLPPAPGEIYRENAGLARLRQVLFVSINGRTVLDASQAFHATSPGQVILGANVMGGSTTAPNFRGRILSGTRIPPARILSSLGAASPPR